MTDKELLMYAEDMIQLASYTQEEYNALLLEFQRRRKLKEP
jgi:hypothetical protein